MRHESPFIEEYLDRGVSVIAYLKERYPHRPAEYLGGLASQLRHCCEDRVRSGTVHRGHSAGGELAYYRVRRAAA
jgi:hypothetical protein